ncbi:nocobactin polyketide synthase NbtC [Mycobacterium sp. 155]|uniref:nocobactin polyketide synthase NbtC n=1 Tax=Mycobacterium sp. 155 TaxID=1157943 RepID=UPI0018DEDBA2|nr:nocobactin polyketide synthase NbtC [Mycobacterium sp. 155]
MPCRRTEPAGSTHTPSSVCRQERSGTISDYRLPDGSVPVLLSADTSGLLRAEAAALMSYLHDHPAVPPERVADMLFRTRLPKRYRALAMVISHAGLVEALGSVADGRGHPAVARSDDTAAPRRIAYVLPGQGSQRPGMGALFYQHVPAYRAEADRCDRVFGELFGTSPMGYLLGTTEVGAGTAMVQSALFVQMVALGAMWHSVGIDADVTVGHSQGEIAAAYLSGKMTLEDAVLVLGTRARAAETVASDAFAMAVVATDRDECEEVLARQDGWAQVSVVNSPRMVGISGERDTVQSAVDALAARGLFTRVIPVSYPAHTNAVSQIRDVVVEAVRGGLRHREFLDSDTELIGATLGERVTSDLAVADYWFWNLRNTVRFDRAIAAAVADGTDVFVELSEHPTLHLAIEENLAALPARAMVLGTSERNAGDLSVFTANLAALAVNDIDYRWDSLRSESDATVTLPLLDFPNTRMNELPLWLPYHGVAAPRASVPAEPTVQPAPQPRPDRDVRARVLVEQWKLLTHRAVVAPRSLGIVDHTGECADLAAALRTHAELQELHVRMVTSPADTEGVDALVVLQPALERMTLDAVAAQVTAFFAGRAWWFPPAAGLTDYWLITVGAEPVLADDGPPEPVAAALAAGFRCLSSEYADTAFRHLDLPAGRVDAGAIIAALHAAGEPELALREGGLYAKRLVDTGTQPTTVSLTGRHVLITGGTGAVGLEFADHAAQAGARRITLASRSGMSSAIADRLRRLSETTDIRVVACDVTDPDAVARLAGDMRDAPVDLLVHAVMDGEGTGDTAMTDLSADQISRGLRGKAIGLARVLEAVPLSGEARILLCSSMASVLGGRGKIVYAAANRLLDAFAHTLRAEGRDCVSVQWGQWAVFEGGGRAEIANLAEIGYRAMPSTVAIELGLSRLPATAAVVAFDLDRARSRFDLLGYGPTLSELAQPVEPRVVPVVDRDEPDVRQRLLSLFAEVIGLDDLQALDSTAPLVASGLDSLNALQLRRRIKTEFGCEVAASDLLGGADLDDVIGWVEADGEPAAAGGLDLNGIRSARQDLDLFGLAAMSRLLDPVLSDGDAHHTAEIVERLQIVDRHQWILRQWLGELVTRGFVGREAGGYRRLRPPPSPTRSDLVAVCEDLGYPAPFGKFLAAANEHLGELVADRLSLQELLFPDGSTATADAFYRDNVISRHLNQKACEAVSDTVRRLMTERSPVRILELGAGVGGMTNAIVGGLAGLPVEYHFTDVSTFFLNAAQKRFADTPWMTFGMVDLNTDLGEQPPCDIVVAANVVHNAHDIGRTLDEIHAILRPGGAVILIELCTAHCSLMTSVYFLMSPRPGQPQVGLTDVRAGTDRILLTRDEWHGEFTRAGFTPALTLPTGDDPLALLDQYLLAAVRKT